MKQTAPNYKQIYVDILNKKFPNKKSECNTILSKSSISGMEIIALNKIIFGTNKESNSFNQKYRCYSKIDIIQILDYQKKNKLNNSQLANHFSLSRNTIAKWKKIFIE